MDVSVVNCCDVLCCRLRARGPRRRPPIFPRGEVPSLRCCPRDGTQDAQGHAQINQSS